MQLVVIASNLDPSRPSQTASSLPVSPLPASVCPSYGKLHSKVCRKAIRLCYNYNQEGHMVRDYLTPAILLVQPHHPGHLQVMVQKGEVSLSTVEDRLEYLP